MKKIRSLFLIFAVAALTYSCGEAGFGFDVASELPVDAGEMVVPIPGTGIPLNINPEVNSFQYDLDEVDGFADALNDLRTQSGGAEIYLTGIAYEFTGVNDAGETYDEAVPIEEARMDFFLSSGATQSLVLPLAGGTLSNTPYTPLDIAGVKTVIQQELLDTNGGDLNVAFVFDMGTITTPPTNEQVDFDITIYFDVTLRVENIND